jgi:radical SAM protein with 4Fe4S-binding SPASM domain|tara:strand:+ start:6274 stop:6873 length:600 start_codon:yes stop_codon:yes gene_type:complete
MPDEIFDKILADLKDIDFKGGIHPYLMGEPLTDVKIAEKVKKIRSIFPENVIYLSTNGDYLTTELIENLIDAGITWFGVSHYDSKNQHLIKLTKKYGNIVHTSLGRLRHSFYNRGGNVKIGCIIPRQKCEWIFEKAYINYKGDVILCCSDYKYEVVFGNVLDDSFDRIYNSKEYNRYRDFHSQQRGKELKLCRNCNRIN